MADGIMGILSSCRYGYSVKMLVNGKDVGPSGGRSEGKRIFSTDHPMYADAPPELRELAIRYEGMAIITPKWAKHLETAADSEKTETFTFNSE